MESKSNLVLVGMPGCGKSRIGELVAKLLKRDFIDLDQQVVRRAGMSIAEIFAVSGEPHFRQLERIAAEEAAARSAVVIATGGGTIIQPGAPELFRRSGLVCYIRRPVEKLQTAHGRPLSADRAAVKALYAARRSAYEAGSDFYVDNVDMPPEEVAGKIAEKFTSLLKTLSN